MVSAMPVPRPSTLPQPAGKPMPGLSPPSHCSTQYSGEHTSYNPQTSCQGDVAGWPAADQGMSVARAGTGQTASEFVHLRDLGYSSSGIRKVAIDLSDGEEVALKLLQRGSQAIQAKSPVAASIERDAIIHSQLHHPNIIGFKRIFLTDAMLGIVHENATTGNLRDMLKTQGPFQESLARFFFQQLMCGMRYLHERGVTHGDIRLKYLLVKPFNFTFSKAPVLKISHFGSAKEDNTVVPAAATHKVPPRPPSQATSRVQGMGLRSGLRSDDILAEDKASDVLACGAILYTMLTQRAPSHSQPASSSAGHNTADALDTAQDGPLQSLHWPSKVTISSACKDLLQAMLCTDSAARPTVHEILEHPWYMQDLPREIQGNARGLAHCQMKRCEQPPEEVKELIRQARHVGLPGRA